MTQTTTEEHQLLAAGGDVVHRFCSVAPREAVFSDTVTALVYDPETNGIIALDHANSWAGSLANIERHMTVDIGSTAGARDIGSVRLRYLDSTNTRMTIGETAPADLPVLVGHHITIRLEYLPYSIAKRIVITRDIDGNITAVTEYLDYSLAYPGGANPFPPKANITAGVCADGTPKEVGRAGFVDDYNESNEKTYRTLNLSARHCVPHNVGSNVASVVWSWTGSGSLVGSLSTDIDIVLRLDVGFHYLKLVCVDSEGVTSDPMRIGIWVHNGSYMPMLNFYVLGDETFTGRDVELEFFGDANDASVELIPTFAHVCYWEIQEPTSESMRYQATGWVTEDRPTLKIAESLYSIKIGGTQVWKQKFRANSITLIDTGGTPTTYTEVQSLTIDRALDFSLRAVDTLRMLVNVYYTDVTAISERVTLPLGNAWNQIVKVAERARMAMTRCDSVGNIWFVRHYSYRWSASKGATPNAIALDTRDWPDEMGLQLPEELVRKVGTVNADGEYWAAGARILYASQAPGLRSGFGVGFEKLPDQFLELPLPQATLNFLAGCHYWWLNNPLPNVPLRMLGNMDIIEPAWGSPVTILWAEETVRGTQLQSALFLVTRVNIAHGRLAETQPKLVTWTLEAVTSGADGETAPVLQMGGSTQVPDTTCAITADFSFVVTGCSVAFTDTSIGDLIFQWYWIFGDGSISVEQNPVHIFAGSGIFAVSLRAVSDCGEYSIDIQNVTIVAEEFDALFSADGVTLETAFVNESIADSGIVSYEWDFGDDSGTSDEENPVHTFPAPGSYTVTLTIVTACGNTDSYTQEVSPPATLTPNEWNSLAQRVGVIYNDGFVGDTSDFLADDPTWDDDDALPNPAQSITNVTLDWRSPLLRGTGTRLDCWVIVTQALTAEKIYHITDLGGSKTPTLEYTATDGITFSALASDKFIPGRACAMGGYAISGTGYTVHMGVSVRTEGGGSWTRADLTDDPGPVPGGETGTVGGRGAFALAYSPQDGTLYSGYSQIATGWYIGVFTDVPVGIHRSTDNGETFDTGIYQSYPEGDGDCTTIVCSVPYPYDTMILYWGYTKGSGGDRFFYRGAGDITAFVGLDGSIPDGEHRADLSVHDTGLIVVAGFGDTGATSRALRSVTDGASWNMLEDVDLWIGCTIAGNDTEVTLWWGRNGVDPSVAGVSVGNGVPDRKGNMRAATPLLMYRLE